MREFGDPVDALQAVGADGLDGIADEFLVLVASHDHGGAGEEGRGVAGGAPQRAAGIDRLAFVGIEQRRGPAEWMPSAQISRSALTRMRAARGVGELQRRCGQLSCEKATRRRSRTMRSSPMRFSHGLEQAELQRAARERDLRRVEAGEPAARLGPDSLAVAVVVDQLARSDAVRQQHVDDAVGGENPRSVGKQIDADAERLDVRRRLVNTDVMAFLRQRDCRGKPADAGAGDRNAHAEDSPVAASIASAKAK